MPVRLQDVGTWSSVAKSNTAEYNEHVLRGNGRQPYHSGVPRLEAGWMSEYECEYTGGSPRENPSAYQRPKSKQLFGESLVNSLPYRAVSDPERSVLSALPEFKVT